MAGTPPVKLLLEQSINTDTPDYDIRPFDPEVGPAPHIRNNGIERNGGIKNVYQATYTKAQYESVIYTKAGRRVTFQETTGEVKVNGISIGTLGQTKGIRHLLEAPGLFDDYVAADDGTTSIGLRMGTSSTAVETWDYLSGVFTVRTAAPYVITIPVGSTTYLWMRFVRVENPADGLSFLYVMAQRQDYTIDILRINGTTLFSITGLTAIGEFVAYTTVASGTTRVFVVQTDTPNTWTWTSAGPTLTAVAGYGYPYANSGTAVWTLAVFRVPTTSNVIGKTLDMKATTTFTDITLSGTPTSIHYYRLIYGGVFVSYATAGGDRTDIARHSLLTGFSMLNVNLRRCYMPEIVGALGRAGYFNAGVYSVNGVASYIGVFSTDGQNTGFGPMLSEVGSLDSTYLPVSGQWAITYRDPSGRFHSIIGDAANVNNRLQLIDDEIVLLNTTSQRNIIDAELLSLEVGPNSYNGSIIIDVPSASPGVPLVVGSQFHARYGGGVDTGEKTLTGVGTLTAARYYPYAMPGEPVGGTPIDIYENSLYLYTTRPGGLATAPLFTVSEIDKADTVYIQDLRLPTPTGAVVTESGFSVQGKTYLRELAYAAYTLGNDIPKTGRLFFLYGDIYLFDGDTISRIARTSGGAIQSIDKIAPADGLTFLAVTPTEAWFLSAWDNSLWTFTGGRNVEKKIRLNAKDAITAGAYCGASNELVLYESAGKSLYIRDGIITETTLGVTATGTTTLQPDINGVWVVPQGGAGNIAQLRYNATGATKIDLDFQTAYHGLEFWKKATFKEYVFTIYDPAKTAGTLTGTWYSFDELGPRTAEARTFTLSYDTNGLARISFIPAQGQAIAGSMRLQASTPMTVLDGYVFIEDNNPRIISENRGA